MQSTAGTCRRAFHVVGLTTLRGDENVGDRESVIVRIVYDSENSNPLENSNVLSITETPGIEHGAIDLPADGQVTPRTTTFTYEPVTNGVLSVTQPGGAVTLTTYEYQESSASIEEMRDYLATFGIDPATLDKVPTRLFDHDVNGDGITTYARPLPVAVREPGFLDETGARAAVTTQIQYDGFGKPTKILRAGHQTLHNYAPLNNPYEAQLPPSQVPAPSGPPRDSSSSGGPLASTTEITDYSSASFQGRPRSVSHKLTYHHGGPMGRLSSVGHGDPNQSVTTYEYDDHYRLAFELDPDELTLSWVYDGVGRVLETRSFDRPTQAGIYPMLERIRNLYGPNGAVLASCTMNGSGGCSGDLDTLLSARATGATESLLTTTSRDGEDRPWLIESPEGRQTMLSYHSWGPVVAAYSVGPQDASVRYWTADLDTLGQPYRFTQHGDTESLTSEQKFDGFGRPIATLAPSGLFSISAYDIDGRLVARGSDQLPSVRVGSLSPEDLARSVVLERDSSGRVHSVRQSYLDDLSQRGGAREEWVSPILYDSDGRASCVAEPSGLERRLLYSSDGQVAASETFNTAAGQGCSGAAGTFVTSSGFRRSKATGTAWSRTLSGVGPEQYSVTRESFFDWSGKIETRTETRGGDAPVTYRYGYDRLGRLRYAEDEWATRTSYRYDAAGRLIEKDENQVAGASSTTDLQTHFAYDRDGLLVTQTGPEQPPNSYTYDALGRLIRSSEVGVDGSPLVTYYQFDGLDRLIRRENPEGYWDGFQYQTGTRQLLGASYVGTGIGWFGTTPNMGLSYSYDALGNLTSAARTERGVTVTTTRQHDGLGRVISETTALPDASYGVAFDYAAQGRLSDLLVFDANTGAPSFDEVQLGFTYQGFELSRVDGYRVGANQALSPVYAFEQQYNAWIPDQRTFRFDPVEVASVPPTTTWTLQLDGHGRPTSTTLYQGEQAAQLPLATEERFYGKDNRLLGNVRTWESDAGPSWGTLRVAAYDGKGRLTGLRTAEAADSGAVYDWYSWLGEPAHQSALQDLQLDPKQTTTDPQLGGNWTAFTRNDLGTLTAVDVDDQQGVEWTASTFANGPGLEEVTLSSDASSSQFPIVWDRAGRANTVDGHWFLWTGDDRPAQVLVGHAHGQQMLLDVEDHYYDAFGRNVRISLNGAILDRVYAGAELVKEVSDCAERTWWVTGTQDQPAAYTVRWDDAACPLSAITDPGDSTLRVMDLSLGTLLFQPEFTSPDGATFGVVQDLRGDVVGLVDTQGNLVEGYSYDVYGERTVQGADGTSRCTDEWFAASPCFSAYGNPRGYAGMTTSNVTGLVDMRNRVYDPRLKIFLSRDPAGFVDGYDPWQYVGGDPLNFVDPWGLGRADAATAGAAAGAAGPSTSTTPEKKKTASNSADFQEPDNEPEHGAPSASPSPQKSAKDPERSKGRMGQGRGLLGIITDLSKDPGIAKAEKEALLKGLTDLDAELLKKKGYGRNLEKALDAINDADKTITTKEVKEVTKYLTCILAGADLASDCEALSKAAETTNDEPIFDIDAVIRSGQRPTRDGAEESKALASMKKKIDRGDKAFQGLEKTEATAEQVIREILSSEKRIFRPATRRDVDQIDVIDSATGRGVRIDVESGSFDTFVNQ